MSLVEQIQHRFTRTSPVPKQAILRDGQIIQGEITKIYPNNRAEIKLGRHKMVAEITTALTIGHRYFFQVQHKDKQILLKVISERHQADEAKNIAALLQELQIKPRKDYITFVQSLLDKKIPFQGMQLVEALQILQSVRQQPKELALAMARLEAMLQNSLPISAAIFQALTISEQTMITPLLESFLVNLQNKSELTPIEEKLSSLMQTILKGPDKIAPFIGKLFMLMPDDGDLVRFLHMTGMTKEYMTSFPPNIDGPASHLALRQLAQYFSLSSQVSTEVNLQAVINEVLASKPATTAQAFLQVVAQLNLNQEEAADQTWTNKLQVLRESPAYLQQETAKTNEAMRRQLPTRTDLQTQVMAAFMDEEGMKSVTEATNTWQDHAKAIKQEAQKLLAIYQDVLREQTLTSEQRHTMKDRLLSTVFPLLAEPAKAMILPLMAQDSAENQTVLLQTLQTLAHAKVPEMLHILEKAIMMQAEESAPIPLQQQFLQHVQQFIQLVGMGYEQQLKEQLRTFTLAEQIQPKQMESMKALLLQIANHDTQIGKQAQQVIHFINGMQLQSLQDTGALIYATLQLPGDKFALNQDIFLQFEGKKQADDKLDPDFCRILLVLDLQNLKETVIDMHIQKRIISITVYNDHYAGLEDESALQTVLSDQLSKQSYQLSAINWKALYERKTNYAITHREVKEADKSAEIAPERYDFRI